VRQDRREGYTDDWAAVAAELLSGSQPDYATASPQKPNSQELGCGSRRAAESTIPPGYATAIPPSSNSAQASHWDPSGAGG